MKDYLFLIPVLPFAGSLILALTGRRLTKSVIALVGVGSVAFSALVAMVIGYGFVTTSPSARPFTQTLWSWMQFDGYAPAISFSLDPLSLIMVLVITIVGFLIHVYSAEYMLGDEGYSRFFTYMNLFVGAMLILVLADNLVFLYLGWEGVGLCSYLLIGFWYRDPVNGRAARKAFVVTRIGDTALAIGLFLLFTNLGTLNIQELMEAATTKWPVGSETAVLAAALLLGGALGKSAQVPLQVWLPDAMAGPTPVSALIHAATMVTAGVYLIARTHVLFELAPPVQHAVAVIGAITLLIAGFSALAQHDIKRVLAYSTISQIGYMFLALGVGAWSAAMFHFMTHAFFKALLFLGAGVVILAQHEEHDIFKMGGLRSKLPLTFWTFLIGAASLSALPLVTAGFYSKDMILWQAWSSSSGNVALWAAGLLGAFLTSIYIFRVVLITFFGQTKKEISYRPGPKMTVPLVILAVLSIIGGFVELPDTLGNLPLFSHFLQPVFREQIVQHAEPETEILFQLVAALVSLSGISIAYLFFFRSPHLAEKLAQSRAGAALGRFWFSGWRFDWLYEKLLIDPFLWIVGLNKNDFIDSGYTRIASVNRALHSILSRTQTGNLRWYAMGIAVGAVVFLGLIIMLTP
ncbi:MAG TPA: NADH-quinone oxidoreductase subunit L [Nitrospirota bacterium]|nr:NADH-quinone oxidoreductase subunit L [Nitrospirota bacterium]